MAKIFVGKSKTIFALLAAVSIAVSFAGCGQKVEDKKTENLNSDLTPTGTVSYPIPNAEGVTLKYWRPLELNISKFASNASETAISKELEKRTGVKVEYVHPTGGSELAGQAFNLMLASKDLPDILEFNVNNLYPGGPEKAISDEVIIPLNNYAPQYSPDYVKFLDANPEVKEYCVNGSGKMIMYPSTLNEKEVYAAGPMIRKDILDELSLPVPETIAEWYETLTAIKQSGKAEIPLSWSEKAPKLKWSGEFTGAFGVLLGAWQADKSGKVEFGAAIPEYKEFLTEFNKWFNEGLIDMEFSAQDRNTLRAKVANGKVAAYRDSAESMVDFVTGWRQKDPQTKQTLVGAPHPVMNKGEDAIFGVKSLPVKLNFCAVISTKCQVPEIAAQFLNYGYTEEGAKLYSYGIEGKSYDMVDGKAVAKDFIINPPTDITLETSKVNWLRTEGPYIDLETFIPDSSHNVQEYIEAKRKVWTNVDNRRRLPEMPPALEDAAEYGSLYTEIDMYVDEMFVKFIMGQRPLSEFNQYVEQLNKMGLKECRDIQQKAYDNWPKR